MTEQWGNPGGTCAFTEYGFETRRDHSHATSGWCGKDTCIPGIGYTRPQELFVGSGNRPGGPLRPGGSGLKIRFSGDSNHKTRIERALNRTAGGLRRKCCTLQRRVLSRGSKNCTHPREQGRAAVRGQRIRRLSPPSTWITSPVEKERAPEARAATARPTSPAGTWSHAGIVDPEVDTAEPVKRLLEQPAPLAEVRHVGLDGQGMSGRREPRPRGSIRGPRWRPIGN